MMANPIKYTSRTYRSIITDINSDAELASKPAWWKRVWAGIGDALSIWLNAQANDNYLETAFTRRSVYDMLKLIDYDLAWKQTSSGTILFYLNPSTVSFPVTFSASDLVAVTSGTLDVESKRFEARTNITVSQTTETFTADDATDELTVAREYTTGEKVRVSSAGTLPSGLSSGTDYYVIKVDATTIKLATSIANAHQGTEIDITSTGSGTHTIELFSFQKTLYQQRSITQYVAGEGDGSTEWLEIPLRDRDIIPATIEVIIDSVTWTKVDTLVDSNSTNTHYRLIFNNDGSSFLMFGDGTYGKIPGNFEINVSYAVGGGVNSNVTTVNRINIYGASNTDITGVSNPASITGGTSEESIINAKREAPLLLKARNRFVTAEDGEALSRDFTGASAAYVEVNAFGVLSARVVVVAPGGGNLSSGDQSDLQAYLVNRSVLEAMDIRVEDVTFVTVSPSIDINVLSSYSYSDIEPYIDIAARLVLSETGQEIRDDYLANGLESAVDLINTIFSKSFGESDYQQLDTLLANFDPAKFGNDLNRSNLEGFIDSFVDGVNYATETSLSYPVSVPESQITTIGTITLAEV